MKSSLDRSLTNLRTDVLDCVFIHSNGDDRQIIEQTETVSILQEYRARGSIRAIGFSGKTVEGAILSLGWADLLMVEYHLHDTSHGQVIRQAADAGVGVFVKKGLSSGKLPPGDSIRFIRLAINWITSLVVGGLSIDHFRENWQVAMGVRNQ